MPVPFTLGAAAFGGAVASTQISAFLAPWTRAAHYGWNRVTPNMLPDAPDLIAQMYKGRLGIGLLTQALQRHGISLTPIQGWPNIGRIWNAVIDSAKPVLSLDDYRVMRAFNVITPAQRENAITRMGYASGAESLMASADITPYATGDILTLLNRNKLSEVNARKHLWAIGHGTPAQQDDLLSLRYQIPGPSDLVTFAVREVWNEQVVNDFGYDEEFDLLAPFIHHMNQQGMGDIPAELRPPGSRLDSWPKAYWRAHWQLMSPQQGYEALHRLRPNRLPLYAGLVDGLEAFQFPQMEQLLKVADYPPKFRKWLAALSYNVLTRADIRHQFETGVMLAPEAKEYLRDTGYTATDADKLVTYFDTVVKLRRFKSAAGKAESAFVAAYKLGTIDASEFRRYVYSTRIDQRPDYETWTAAGQDQRQAIADADPYVQSIVAGIDSHIAADHVNRQIRMMRRRFIMGLMDNEQARRGLQSAGIVPGQSQRYIDEWSVEKDLSGKIFSVSQIFRLYRRYIITADDFIKALTTLNWDRDDAMRLLALANYDLRQDANKVLLSQAKDEAKAEKAALQVIANAKKQIKEAQAALASHSSPQKMHDWVKRGLMDGGTMYGRLIALGWTADDATREVRAAEYDNIVYLQSAAEKAQKAADKAAKLAAKQPAAP